MVSTLSAAQSRIACQSRLFAGLPPDVCDRLLAAARIRRFQRGEAVFYRGDTAHAIHVVIEGWVKLYRIAPSGTEAVVGVMTRGQSFGEPIALRRAAYPVSAEAATDCQLLMLPAQAFLDLFRTHPETAISVLSATFVHLQELVEQIEQLKARSGAQRVAEFLLELCPEGADSATVTLPYDKALIAGRLGMKPESLSRAFARLRDFGVTVNQASAKIGSVSRLQGLAHDDGSGALSRPM